MLEQTDLDERKGGSSSGDIARQLIRVCCSLLICARRELDGQAPSCALHHWKADSSAAMPLPSIFWPYKPSHMGWTAQMKLVQLDKATHTLAQPSSGDAPPCSVCSSAPLVSRQSVAWLNATV